MTTKPKIYVSKLATTKDALEYMLEANYKNIQYISFVEIADQRLAFEKNNRKILEQTKTKFQSMVVNGKIRPIDRIKFCYRPKGDFIIFIDHAIVENLILNVSRYSKDRLHIEIPKEYRYLFEEGDKVTIKKE